MPLTKQQLLIPRVLCIGEKGKPLYPNPCHFSGGDILTRRNETSWTSKDWEMNLYFCDEWIEQYSHLFKPLPWWYGRTVEEMPEYILASKTYGIVKVNEWRCMGELCLALTDDGMLSAANWEFEPADESDYQEYQKQKQ